MPSTATTPSGIAYDRVDGTGIPVVLLHAGVADRRMWDALWADLSAERPAVRLDLRGFGDSDVQPAGDWSHAGDVRDTLAHLGIERCHLVGASFGAGVAVETALDAPAAVESLLLCPPGGSLLAELTDDLAEFFAAERAALEADDLDAAVEANLAAWVVGPGRAPDAVAPGVLDAVRAMQRRAFEIDGSWSSPASELEPPALDRLGAVAARTLVLVGGHDLDTTRDAADRLVAGIPVAVRRDWPDTAHLPSMERPRDFLDLLLDWTSPGR